MDKDTKLIKEMYEKLDERRVRNFPKPGIAPDDIYPADIEAKVEDDLVSYDKKQLKNRELVKQEIIATIGMISQQNKYGDYGAHMKANAERLIELIDKLNS